jgi:multidrug efflux pump subunit AcrA (membrane-fusion protein)
LPAKLKLIDEREFIHDGQMDFVDNVIERTTGTIRGRAQFANPKDLFTPGMFARNRLVLVTSPMLLVEGILQSQDGVLSIRAATVQPISVRGDAIPSHDFG